MRSAEIEDASGLDRYTLARQFRRLLGMSPHRYLLMRRLALARRRIERGDGLAAVANETGFADQSHLTRHFKRAFGVPPGRWAALAGRAFEARNAPAGAVCSAPHPTIPQGRSSRRNTR